MRTRCASPTRASRRTRSARASAGSRRPSTPSREPYGADAAQFVEHFGEGSRRVALLHGGFWRAKYACDLEHAVAEDLAARGFAVVNVEYRRGAGWEAMSSDIRAALSAWPCSAVIGHSAGGHLALWAAAEGLTGAAVSQGGVNDLGRCDALRLSDDAVREMLEAPAYDADPGWTPPASADPWQRRPIDARLLCVHGALDTDVPMEFSTAWEDDADVVVIEDEGHFEHLDPQSECWAAVVAWL